MIIEVHIRDITREAKVRVSPEFLEGLKKEVELVVHKAIDRARKNARLTVQPQDL